ncbi:MAG: transcriptional repressor [Bacteroidales bacterium]|nr:transcriptional repressor [Bacteroidales bacterium]
MEKNNRSLDLEEFRYSLRKYGLKVTPQRIAVHKAMLNLVHASADMVTSWILNEGEANVTVASVYNILTQLSMLGIYKHRLSSNNKMYFDVITTDHLHLYDTLNHSYVDVMDDLLYKELERKILPRRFKGYKIDGLDIQILVHPVSRGKK